MEPMTVVVPNWILHNNQHGEDPTVLAEYLKATHRPYRVVAGDYMDSEEELSHKLGSTCLPPVSLVIARGTIWWCRDIQSLFGWVPGTFVDFEALRFDRYCWWVGDDLFNYNYRILPAGDLGRVFRSEFNQSWLANQHLDSLFVRPVSSKKPFGGQVVRRNQIIVDRQVSQQAIEKLLGVDPDSLVVIGPDRSVEIQAEYRLIIVRDRAVEVTQYMRRIEGRLEIEEKPVTDYLRASLIGFAGQVARRAPSNYPTVYTMDIAETATSFEVLELNGFGSSGLYASDPAVYVEPIEAEAARLWKEQYGDPLGE